MYVYVCFLAHKIHGECKFFVVYMLWRMISMFLIIRGTSDTSVPTTCILCVLFLSFLVCYLLWAISYVISQQ